MIDFNENSLQLGSEARTHLLAFLNKEPKLETFKHQWVGKQLGSADPGYDLTLLVRDRKTEQVLTLFVVIKSRLQPKQARAAVYHLKRKSQSSDFTENFYCIAIAPTLSCKVTDILEEEDMGWLDFGGNGHLDFGGNFIHIEGRPIPKEYRERSPQKSLFTPKASRLLRVLLQGPFRAYKVEELAVAAGVSMGQVSKVRKLLLDQELAGDEKDGIRIERPHQILTDWILADDFSKRVETREYSSLEQDHDKIARTLDVGLANVKHAFTQWTAAHLRQPYVPPQVTSVYVDSFPDDEELKKILNVRRVNRGGRLRLYKPADEGVFIGKQNVNGLPLVSDLQIFLDLLESGDELRANEAARELRDLPDFNGGWA